MSSTVSPLAGKPLDPSQLIDVAALTKAYFDRPDPTQAAQRVAFGTSGHRGSAFQLSFNEMHILAIAQAICAYRKPGHMGDVTVTQQGLRVVRIDADKNLVLIKGAVPGANGGLVMITKSHLVEKVKVRPEVTKASNKK